MNGQHLLLSVRSTLRTQWAHAMKHKLSLLTLALALAALLLPARGVTAQFELEGKQEVTPPAYAGTGAGSGFTYQGYLKQNALPVSGTCDIRFSLWDSSVAGTQLGGSLLHSGVEVKNGLFTERVNVGDSFGPSAYNGNARFLQFEVRCPAGAGAYTTLSRQRLDAVPYAQALALPYERTANGPAKAAVFATCGNAGSSILRSFNNVNTTAITITNGPFAGTCTIDFGFDVSDRYVVATSQINGFDMGQMVAFNLALAADSIDFFRVNSGNSVQNGNIMVLVY